MRNLSIPEYKVLLDALFWHKQNLQHVMKYHLGGYTKERKDKLDITSKLIKEMKDGLRDMEKLQGTRTEDNESSADT